MRKFVMTAALAGLAMATAADAHVAGPGSSRCGYGAADMDTVLEMARLDPRGGSGLALA